MESNTPAQIAEGLRIKNVLLENSVNILTRDLANANLELTALRAKVEELTKPPAPPTP